RVYVPLRGEVGGGARARSGGGRVHPRRGCRGGRHAGRRPEARVRTRVGAGGVGGRTVGGVVRVGAGGLADAREPGAERGGRGRVQPADDRAGGAGERRRDAGGRAGGG